MAVHRPAGARPTSGRGVALGADVGFGVAVGDGDGVADGGADAGPVTGLAEGDASCVELQPPINPTIPNATTSVVSFMLFIAFVAPVDGRFVRMVGRLTRTAAIA
jgi:hypothetical protein